MVHGDLDLAALPRWRGSRGRMEVWYATLTDASGAGVWVHYETVAPVDGEPYGHGWLSLFPTDRAPTTERFGPAPVSPAEPGATRWFAIEGAAAGPGRLSGATGSAEWDLSYTHAGHRPLWTFPRPAWERNALPGAQVLAVPSARWSGPVKAGDVALDLDAVGGLAHIYGHGSAERWAWLHADLGDGDVCEVVTAVSTRPGLRRLPPTAFVRLRTGGRDWPPAGLPAVGTRTSLGLPDWSVRGVVGRHRLRIDVHQPAERCVALEYRDPDGATATCTNTEQADARIRVDRLTAKGWHEVGSWSLDGTAHAEVGRRP